MGDIVKKRLISSSSHDTEAIGERLAANLQGGEVIELVSDVGGGKTTLVRGLARGLGSSDHVSSPTFTICNTYNIFPERSHADGVQGDNEKRASRTDSTLMESRKQATQQRGPHKERILYGVESATSDSGVEGSALKQTDTVRTIRHYDFYRLGKDAGLMSQELQEALQDTSTVTIVEWGQVVHDVLPLNRLTITLQAVSDNERKVGLATPKILSYLLEGVC